MKAFLIACVAIVVISVGASLTLDMFQKPADQAYTTSGVRM